MGPQKLDVRWYMQIESLFRLAARRPPGYQIVAEPHAARLILAVLDEPAWRDELPRLVVGALGRQRDGAWSTTTANLWGAIALDRFSAKFESQALTGSSTVRIDTKPSGDVPMSTALASGGVDWAKQPAGGAVAADQPDGRPVGHGPV